MTAATITQEQAALVTRNLISERFPAENGEFTIRNIDPILQDTKTALFAAQLLPTGFVLIAADDAVQPILGYGWNQSLDLQDIPPQLQKILDSYTDQIAQARQNTLQSTGETAQLWDHYTAAEFDPDRDFRDVAPMLSANWSQAGGFNQYCPGSTLVGCVAVSMGQVMYHWEFPESGIGYHIYFEDDFGQQQVDFSDAVYEYDEMSSNYATSEAAELLYHCGVAVEMDYGYSGSGAQVGGDYYPTAYTAMQEHFLFNEDSLQWVWRGDYSENSWNDMIRNEMDLMRPVIYAGYDVYDGGGHAWNVDGYQGNTNTYFHCNWGWGGSSNGYFSLSSLNAGGYYFNDWQQAIIGIQPQSLDAPNITVTSIDLQETVGDGDGIINPGESVDINLSFMNQMPWGDALSMDLILTSPDEDIVITNDYLFTFDYIPSGTTYVLSDPFSVEVSASAALDTYELELLVLALGADGMSMFEGTISIPLQVSLNQPGFPLPDLGQITAAPALADLDGDGIPEIITGGFNDGEINITLSDGSPWPGFPQNVGDVRMEGTPAVADLDTDGTPEIVFTAYSTSPNQGYLFIVHPETADVNVVSDGLSGHKIYGPAALGQLDADPQYEIVTGTFATDALVTVFNHDGSTVAGFPLTLGEKITAGAALADINGNGLDDIVVGTLDEQLYLIYDDGSIADGYPILVDHDFRAAPVLVEDASGWNILCGSRDNYFYAFRPDGSQRFAVETGNDIFSSAAVLQDETQTVIFFGSQDGLLYGIDLDGNALPGWPVTLSGGTDFDPVISDLDNDQLPEIIIPTNNWALEVFHLDGSTVAPFPVDNYVAVSSSPAIIDLDNDSDLEIVFGDGNGFSVLDIKSTGSDDTYWSQCRGNLQRTGSFTSSVQNESPDGDVNGDDILDVLDIIIVVGAIMDGSSDDLLAIADINQDGVVNVLDIVAMVDIIMG